MRLLPLALLLATTFGWSDPLPVARTTVAVPPAVAVLRDRVHVFWLDRAGPAASSGDVWYALLSADGGLVRSPSRLRTMVDTRLAFPVAVRWGEVVAAAWMTRGAEGVRLEIAVLDAGGRLLTLLRPDAAEREEAGRIALAASPDGTLHAAWSQFDGDERRIWYTRVRETGRAHTPPVPVTIGDAPALMVDPSPHLFWWEDAGAGRFRLLTGSLATGRLSERRPLTGAISLTSPLPVLPVVFRTGSVLLIPTLERAFSSSGRLYAMRLGAGVELPRRVPVLDQSRVADVSLSQDEGRAVAIWSQTVGRRQNSELHAARLGGEGEAFVESPSRLTLTIPGSLKPAAAIVEGTLAAVWLEVTGFGEFTLSFGTSGAPRRHRFLLGITELDLYRPGALLPFAALAAGSVLPFALLITATTLLPATLILWLVRLLVEPFPGLERYVQIPIIRLAIILLATLAIQLAAAGLIPGRPAPWLLAIPLAVAAPPVLFVLTRRAESATLTLGLTAVGLVFLQCVIALFPWGAEQLTQF